MYGLEAPKRRQEHDQDRRRQAALELRQSRAGREEDRALGIAGKDLQHGQQDESRAAGRACERKAERNRSLLGQSFIFTPEVIDDIHIKAELGRYRMRGFSLFKKIPHWDDLTFLPGTLTRFVIEGYREKCMTKTVHRPARQAAAGARHPGLHHRHELRRAVASRPRSRWRAAPPWPARRPARAKAA